MKDSMFNPETHQEDVPSKIIVGLERISEAFKALLWNHAKAIGLSPIQIQILIFVAYHKPDLCKVSYLSKEFNVTKATISDAVRVLANKGLLTKETSAADHRSFTLKLSPKGQQMVDDTAGFADPLKQELNAIPDSDLVSLYQQLNRLIFRLTRTGILNVQRTCFGCRFYEKNKETHFCHFLEKELQENEIRLDCPEYEGKPQDADS